MTNLRDEIQLALKENQTLDEDHEGNRSTYFYIDGAVDQLLSIAKEWAVELVSNHTEHEGGYCDTGENMEWACRSDCVKLAIKRIEDFSEGGQ
jgi:hypothetical protein